MTAASAQPSAAVSKSDADSTAAKAGCPPTLVWVGGVDGVLRMIDQTLLPTELREIECHSVEAVWEAIQSLLRRAPAIGVSAAYGVVLGVRDAVNASRDAFNRRLADVTQYLAKSRPTAVNLFWSIDRMRNVAAALADDSPVDVLKVLLDEAKKIEAEDREMCAAIGRFGSELLSDGDGVLTHCNAGSLATAGEGTALSVIFAAAVSGKTLRVFADETRPLLQGARLTAWELMQHGIDVTLICDSMAGWVMKERRIQAVITGADRIAANGDTANKIGTYSVAQLARAHGIPFYVAAPSSTFDFAIADGSEIPIEQRPAEEITRGFGRVTAPEGVAVYNPAFDVTPAELISAIVTERGIVRPVTAGKIREVLSR